MTLKRRQGSLDIRTKLLLMLVVLSLPLLIVGLYQLHSYRASLNDQSAAVARAEADAAAGALESWIEAHPARASDPQTWTASESRELFTRLTRRARPEAQAAVAVYDAEGRAVALKAGAPAPARATAPARAPAPPPSKRPRGPARRRRPRPPARRAARAASGA